MTTRRFTINVITAADGTYTGYTPFLSGRLAQIEYVKNSFVNGVDFTITADVTGATLWTEADVNAAKVCAPRIATHSNAGIAALYAAAGVAVNDQYVLSRDRVKIVLAQGGNATAGTFHIVVEE